MHYLLPYEIEELKVFVESMIKSNPELHAFFCFFPMGGTIIAMIIMWNYSITEGKANEIKEILTKRKNEKSTK